MTRSKDKGTAAETMVVRYLQSTFWPHAERRALAGGLDKGDITGTPGLAWEVKAAKILCVPAWLRETESERVNARADYGILVIKPQGVGDANVGRFWALMDYDRMGSLVQLILKETPGRYVCFDTTVRKTSLNSASDWMVRQPEEFPFVRYPKFVFTTLDCMTRVLLHTGYGSSPT